MNGEISFFADDVAELMLEVKMSPDPGMKPIQLSLKMSALVRFTTPVTTQQMVAWLDGTGPLILFPYVRELVHNVTGRGAFGGIIMTPIPIDQLRGMMSTAWKRVREAALNKP